MILLKINMKSYSGNPTGIVRSLEVALNGLRFCAFYILKMYDLIYATLKYAMCTRVVCQT